MAFTAVLSRIENDVTTEYLTRLDHSSGGVVQPEPNIPTLYNYIISNLYIFEGTLYMPAYRFDTAFALPTVQKFDETVVWRFKCPVISHFNPFTHILVGGFEHVLFSISYMGCHPSHWRTRIFQDGYCTTNQYSVPIFPHIGVLWPMQR